MEWLTNEMILYGGLSVAALSVIALIVCIMLYKLRKLKLINQLNKEYGEPLVKMRKKRGRRDGV